MKKRIQSKTSKYLFSLLSIAIVLSSIALTYNLRAEKETLPESIKPNIFFESDLRVSELSVQTVKDKLGEPYDRIEDYIESEDISTLELKYPFASVKFYKDCADTPDYTLYELMFFKDDIQIFENITIGDDLNNISLNDSCIHEFVENNSIADSIQKPDTLYNKDGQISYIRYYFNDRNSENASLKFSISDNRISEISLSKDSDIPDVLIPIANYFKE